MLQVGRMVIPDTVHVTSYSGSGLSLEGSVLNGDPTEFAIYVAQFRGLFEDTEPVPVVWSEDETMDGFYRVEGVSARIAAGSGPRGRHVPWTLDLERVPGNPAIQSHLIGGVRTNAIVIDETDAEGWHAAPGDLLEYEIPGASISGATRSSEDGTINVYVPFPGDLFPSVIAEWSIEPANYQIGAATLYDSDGNVLTGRSGVPASIGNALLRVELVQEVIGVGGIDLRVSSYNGASWSPSTFTLWWDDAPEPFELQSATALVLRNDPEAASMRVGFMVGGVRRAALDITLRRGARMAELTVMRTSGPETWQIDAFPSAATAITGGYRATSNDTNGDQWVLAASSFTSPAFALSEPVVSFGLGVAVDGSSATGLETPQELVYQYFAAQYETVRFVQR